MSNDIVVTWVSVSPRKNHFKRGFLWRNSVGHVWRTLVCSVYQHVYGYTDNVMFFFWISRMSAFFFVLIWQILTVFCVFWFFQDRLREKVNWLTRHFDWARLDNEKNFYPRFYNERIFIQDLYTINSSLSRIRKRLNVFVQNLSLQ